MLLTTETPREAELINDINDVKVGWEVMEYLRKGEFTSIQPPINN